MQYICTVDKFETHWKFDHYFELAFTLKVSLYIIVKMSIVLSLIF